MQGNGAAAAPGLSCPFPSTYRPTCATQFMALRAPELIRSFHAQGAPAVTGTSDPHSSHLTMLTAGRTGESTQRWQLLGTTQSISILAAGVLIGAVLGAPLLCARTPFKAEAPCSAHRTLLRRCSSCRARNKEPSCAVLIGLNEVQAAPQRVSRQEHSSRMQETWSHGGLRQARLFWCQLQCPLTGSQMISLLLWKVEVL